MKHGFRLRIACLAVIGIAFAELAAARNFMVSSPVMKDGGVLPFAQVMDGFGCAGGNRSPALAWGAPPAGTLGLAITMFDPDARGGSGWWHWAVFNLPPGTRAVAEAAGAPGAASLPGGAVQGRNDFGLLGYGGACPPAGSPPHHYVITIWALDAAALPFDAQASDAAIAAFLAQHEIGKATLSVRYGR